MSLPSNAFISIGRPERGFGSAITGVELATIFDPSDESSNCSFCFGFDCLRPCLNHVSKSSTASSEVAQRRGTFPTQRKSNNKKIHSLQDIARSSGGAERSETRLFAGAQFFDCLARHEKESPESQRNFTIQPPKVFSDNSRTRAARPPLPEYPVMFVSSYADPRA